MENQSARSLQNGGPHVWLVCEVRLFVVAHDTTTVVSGYPAQIREEREKRDY